MGAVKRLKVQDDNVYIVTENSKAVFSFRNLSWQSDAKNPLFKTQEMQLRLLNRQKLAVTFNTSSQKQNLKKLPFLATINLQFQQFFINFRKRYPSRADGLTDNKPGPP